MSDFYKIQLRQYTGDIGFTGGSRPLTEAQNRGNTITRAINQVTQDPFGRFDRLGDVVVFDATPTVGENRSAQYADDPLPGAFGLVVYKTTGNRRFTISGKFVSRTVVEATKNNAYANILRSWMIPQSYSGLSGRPPTVRLNGYKNNFNNIPVVLSDLTINFPEDVDYIDTPDATVPIIQTVEVSLIEAHGMDNLKYGEGVDVSGISDFNLEDFKLGKLPGF